ncbi:AI-2 transport protein TqsA [Bacillus sp. THAF10]|uniref:AI-2E family transporter n=1 Tax=Bacillus sp. THAF10 TaxID=2587848 RepID=UPI0012682D71|nr:AI-2E family transporter [Bacillus sp. THAF10]QFT89178.1 AI-2 transport protein TqsA [Bacillus sp. THAF10]
MPQTKWFKVGYAVIVILLIIFLASLVDFIFTPITIMIQTLFAPIILAGVLYYLLRPLVNLAARFVPRGIAILSIYLAFIGLITLLLFLLGPILQQQVNSLVKNTPEIINDIQKYVVELQENEYIARFQQDERFSLEEISGKVAENLNAYLSTFGSNVLNIISAVTGFFILLVIIPFVLFYMLKDGDRLPGQVLKFIPRQHEREGKNVLKDMDIALSSYIQGQIIVSVFVGVLIYIGFLIIGLEYSLVLALIAMFTNIIPFIGPFIGTIPSLIVAFFDDPIMALWVLIVVIIVQQVESNLISPQVMGKKLDVHPITIIFILLVASKFAGLLGLLLAVPTYAVSKVIVLHTIRFINLRKVKVNDEKLL